MIPTARVELDLRTLPPESAADAVLSRFDALPLDGSLVLFSGDDPRGLFEMLLERRPGVFGWHPYETSPGCHKVEVIRYCPKASETSLSEFYGRDHDEIDAFLVYLRRDLDVARKAGTAAPESAPRYCETFIRRLRLHIRWEEEILFPSVEAKEPRLADGPGRVMRWEHRQILELIGRLQPAVHAACSEPATVTTALRILDELLDVLVIHNQKEESIYYPASEQVLMPEEQEVVMARTREMTA